MAVSDAIELIQNIRLVLAEVVPVVSIPQDHRHTLTYLANHFSSATKVVCDVEDDCVKKFCKEKAVC